LASLCLGLYVLVAFAFWMDDMFPGVFWPIIVAIFLVTLIAYLMWSDEHDQGE
jgi:4-hydroxybenzoate polyprenyltransferase